MSDLSSVCQTLDNLVVSYFQTLDEILCYNKRLETAMKTGFLCLAKARYTMGNKSVSPLQYDNEDMEAYITVDIENDKMCPDFLISWQNKELQAGTEDNSLQDTTVRKRKVTKTGAESQTDERIIEEQTERIKNINISEKSAKRHKDPLKWFGVLVPQALRQSQGSFQGAVEQAVQLAGLKTKLLAIKQNYKETMKLKKTLLKETEILKCEDLTGYEVITAERKQALDETHDLEDEEKQEQVRESGSDVENISAEATEFETSL